MKPLKLNFFHIEDLKPRYIEEIVHNGTKKAIIDTHSHPEARIKYFDVNEDISDILGIMNAQYHNHVISYLWGDWIIEYAEKLKKINYRMGW